MLFKVHIEFAPSDKAGTTFMRGLYRFSMKVGMGRP